MLKRQAITEMHYRIVKKTDVNYVNVIHLAPWNLTTEESNLVINWRDTALASHMLLAAIVTNAKKAIITLWVEK